MAVDLLCLHINLPAQPQVMRIDLFVFRSDIILCDPSGCYSVFICLSASACGLADASAISKTPSSLAGMVLPFWYRLTHVVLEKRPFMGVYLFGASCNSTQWRIMDAGVLTPLSPHHSYHLS